MGLETGEFLDDLVITNPVTNTDPVTEGAAHIRLLKKVITQSLGDMDGLLQFPTNDLWFKQKNAADSAYINMIKVNASDQVEIGGIGNQIHHQGGSITAGTSGEANGIGYFRLDGIPASSNADGGIEFKIAGDTGGYGVRLQAYTGVAFDIQVRNASADWTTIQKIDASGVVISGAITSTGIKDSASALRLEVSDGSMVVGRAGGDYGLVNVVDDQNSVISGGSGKAVGANISLYGSTHATASLVNNIIFRASGAQVYRYNASIAAHDFVGNLTVENAITSTSGKLNVGGGVGAEGTAGKGQVGAASALGLQLIGKGTNHDFTLYNQAALIVMQVAANTGNVSIPNGEMAIKTATPTLRLSNDLSPTILFDRPSATSFRQVCEGGIMRWYEGGPGADNAITLAMHLTAGSLTVADAVIASGDITAFA